MKSVTEGRKILRMNKFDVRNWIKKSLQTKSKEEITIATKTINYLKILTVPEPEPETTEIKK